MLSFLKTRKSEKPKAPHQVCRRHRTVLVLVVAAALPSLFPVHALTVSAVREGGTVLVRKIEPHECFSYHSIHSVELSPVEEHFRIGRDYDITLYETRFQSSNVGLPYAAFGDEVFAGGPEGFRITNMSRKVPQLLIWVNARYDNRLRLGAESWRLNTFKGDTLLRIGVDRLPLFEFIYLRMIQPKLRGVI